MTAAELEARQCRTNDEERQQRFAAIRYAQELETNIADLREALGSAARENLRLHGEVRNWERSCAKAEQVADDFRALIWRLSGRFASAAKTLLILFALYVINLGLIIWRLW